MSVKDFVPDPFEDLRVVVLREIELSTEGCHLFEHGVFLRIKNERKLICEFHISNIGENVHLWEKSGHLEYWHTKRCMLKRSGWFFYQGIVSAVATLPMR